MWNSLSDQTTALLLQCLVQQVLEHPDQLIFVVHHILQGQYQRSEVDLYKHNTPSFIYVLWSWMLNNLAIRYQHYTTQYWFFSFWSINKNFYQQQVKTSTSSGWLCVTGHHWTIKLANSSPGNTPLQHCLNPLLPWYRFITSELTTWQKLTLT